MQLEHKNDVWEVGVYNGAVTIWLHKAIKDYDTRGGTETLIWFESVSYFRIAFNSEIDIFVKINNSC